jgi:aminopeptidase N
MLKYVVGREAFNKSIKHYLLDHAYGNVDTEDLLVAFHETLGLSLDWFWEEWLYKGGEPSYLVSTGETKTSVTFMVNQTQENGAYTSYFKMPIVFEVNFTDGTSASKKVWVEGRETMVIIDIPEGKTVAYTLFDPGNQIIKSVQFSKTFDQLKQQAVKAKYMLDRLDAIQAMVDLPLAQKREFLIQYYGKENWYSIKESIINQLAKDADKKSRSLLKSAISDKDLKVRKALIAAFDTIPADLMKDVEKLLSEPSYALQESVLRKLCLSNPTKIADYLNRTKNEMGDNSRNIRLLWLKLAYKNGKQEVLSELIDFTSSSFEFNTRRNSIGVIKELEVFNEAILKNALDIAYSPNFKLSSAGIGYLNWASGTNPIWRKLIYASAGENHSKWQQEVWKKIMKD